MKIQLGLRDWQHQALAPGAVFAFLETLLVYGTGEAAPMDVCGIFAPVLVLWVVAAAVLNGTLALLRLVLGSRLGHGSGWVMSARLLLAKRTAREQRNAVPPCHIVETLDGA